MLLFGLLILTKCINDPNKNLPAIMIYANSSVATYLPLHVYVDNSLAGTLTDTVQPFSGEFPPMSDDALLKIDIKPGKYKLTVISLPVVQDTSIVHTSLDDILNDISIQPDFYSTKEIDVGADDYIYQGVGH